MNKVFRSALLLGAVVAVTSCETDDVESPVMQPSLTLSAASTTLDEDLSTTTITVGLSETTDEDVNVTLDIAGTATEDMDYTLTGTSVTIPAGDQSAAIQLTTLQDTLAENNETIEISIGTATGASFETTSTLAIIIQDDDGGSGVTVNLILNEILYDPSNSGLEGDANGDGSYAQSEDEFIELVNLSTTDLDMSGFEIYDAENLVAGTPNHTVPANTIIAPGKALVIFGGGTPTGTFGGATVQTSTFGDLNLNNSGDTLTVMDASGSVILTFDIEPLSNNPNESYTRNPDLTGEFEQHGENTSLLFSPGTKIDGTSF
ncbi:MAG: endonuclease [Crocinitomicaceae bacterium]|nr:endonuclease [Crocinitomicaceae bacterium]|tara:strand:- start:5925 stop:6878 length:954 start_codon:yes stop_codon:yes gene_type:complete